MSVELQALEDAVRDFKRDADLDFVDPKRLAAVIDGLQGTLSTVPFQGKRRGDHLLTGKTPSGWVMQTCSLTQVRPRSGCGSGSSWRRCPKSPRRLARARSATNRR